MPRDAKSRSKKLLVVEPHFIAPMKARLAASIPEEKGWFYEIKFDGIRAIAIKNGGEIQLFSRKPLELTAKFPEVVKALLKLPAETFVLDGEIVALDDKGRSSFQLLQNRGRDPGMRSRIFYNLFDLLHLDGRNLTSLPLRERKDLLKSLLRRSSDRLRLSENLDATPMEIWKNVVKLGLEGVIAKKQDSQYESDARSGSWLKIKASAEQEFVIGGYTKPQGGRKFFGAILIGYYKGRELIYSGKVGTGFDENLLKMLHEKFCRLETAACPFTREISELGAADLRRCTWLKPQLVCQIKFGEWTNDGKLRQPVFLGLREDKRPTEVVRETVSA